MKKINNVKSTPNEGVEAGNNSWHKIKEILGVKTLYKPKGQPGVYCIHFQKDDLVYKGQSINVSKEISTLRGGYRLQSQVNEAFL